MWGDNRGIALIVTLLAIALFSALGLGLALSSSTARLGDHNHEDAVGLLNAAESALELASRDLAAIADWNGVLAGSTRSALVDGLPAGTRITPAGDSLDLTRLTNQLTCGRNTPCSEAQRAANSIDRPWGAGNPRWRLFLHAPLTAVSSPRHRVAPYTIVWLGDDAQETDGDPYV
ncbi:MAG: pilus assembly PilX N-terminal domain-containing protein, partial [Vicinamibacterales bacterium]